MSNVLNFPRSPAHAMRVWRNATPQPFGVIPAICLLAMIGLIGHISITLLTQVELTLQVILLIAATVGLVVGLLMTVYRRYILTTKGYIYMMWFCLVGGMAAYVLLFVLGFVQLGLL